MCGVHYPESPSSSDPSRGCWDLWCSGQEHRHSRPDTAGVYQRNHKWNSHLPSSLYGTGRMLKGTFEAGHVEFLSTQHSSSANPHVSALKHRVYKTQVEAAHTETAFSAGPGCPGSSRHIPSSHTCKRTAGTEHAQQLVQFHTFNCSTLKQWQKNNLFNVWMRLKITKLFANLHTDTHLVDFCHGLQELLHMWSQHHVYLLRTGEE